MDQEIKEELEDITLHEELIEMPIEELTAECGGDERLARAIYDVEHDINLHRTTYDDFIKGLKRYRKG